MWFEGPITDAIAATKAEKRLLVVCVHGSDERSQSMVTNWENENVRNAFENKCVALKLDKDSVAAKQFAQIYPLTGVPSSYLIGLNGKAVDIIVESLDAEEHSSRVLKALEIHENAKAAATQLPSTSILTESQSMTVEEKVARAQELLKIKRAEKAKLEEEEGRERELKRREMGKNINETRELMKEREMKEAAEERKREKNADKEHLQKLREQIAADRAEKAKNYESKVEAEQIEVKQKQATKTQKAKDDEENARKVQEERCRNARIQFRKPDGSSAIGSFAADAPFLDAIRFAETLVQFSGEMELIQMFPRREFTANELTTTFKELGLVPNAVLMILPQQRNRRNPNNEGFLARMISLVTSPIFGLVNWVYAIFFGRPTDATARHVTEGSGVEANQGKVHRMPNAGGAKKTDDDDNATWNGNSTQQL